MTAQELKEKLINDSDTVIQILNDCGFCNIVRRDNVIRFARSSESRPDSIKMNLDTLSVVDFARDVKGDIYTLIQYKMNLDFRESFYYLKQYVSDDEFKMPTKKLFGGFFNRHVSEHIELPLYPDDYMSKYFVNVANIRFKKDGIPRYIQYRYDIHYDDLEHRIIIPYHTERGLVGFVGRYNGDYEKDEVPKYYAYDRFQKSNVLYGLYQNYNLLAERRIAFIFEGEKSVMLLSAYGIDLGVSVGGHYISDHQVSQLKYLVDTVIICFDEDIEEATLIEQANKFKKGLFANTKVGYVYDEHNEVLPKGSKCSPVDRGKSDFETLIQNHVKYI